MSSFKDITSLDELDRLFEDSNNAAVVIFKHSNMCGTSAYINEIIGAVPATINRVTVQERRDVSNAITARTGVLHHTPQVFVIKDGKVAHSSSHYSISPEIISEILQ
jgi:bacillithiol system protein YtxJ